jgi:hypothetical protein
MKIVQIGAMGKDFPEIPPEKRTQFEENIKESTRRRLELRPEDEIELQFTY